MERRCHYEVLGLDRSCTADEIKSAYRKLALQRHPDKLVPTGVSQADANAQFQELGHAYEVLSDPKERAWYDSHRSQILFADPSTANSIPDSVIPNLFSFFSTTVFSGYFDSGKGFYKVYSDVFTKIYSNELSHTDLRSKDEKTHTHTDLRSKDEKKKKELLTDMRSEAGEVAGLRSSVGAGGWVRLVVAGFSFSHSGNYLGRMGRMREVRLPLALCVRSVQFFFKW
ncbi:hypothetical protein ACLB2K_065096 [Fragaria x ananassa]